MTPTLSSRDWELLSAYMDDSLDAQQRQRMAARLEAEPELVKALEGLQHTRALLQRAPRARPPRHFKLTPEMLRGAAGRRGRFQLPLNLVSAAATLLLVLVLIGDFTNFGLPLGAFAPSAAQDAAEEPLALMTPEAAEEAEAEPAGEGAAEEEGAAADEAELRAATPEEPAEADEGLATELTETESAAINRRVLLRWAEGVLALIALGSAWLARRSGKRNPE